MTPAISLPAPASHFIPHEGPMMLIDQLVSANDETGTARVHIQEDYLFLTDEGNLDTTAFPELAAQTYAAIRGYELRCAGLPLQPGYLVGIQKCEVLSNARLHDVLTITVTTIGKFSGFAVVEGTVSCRDNMLAKAKIKLYIPSESEREDHA